MFKISILTCLKREVSSFYCIEMLLAASKKEAQGNSECVAAD